MQSYRGRYILPIDQPPIYDGVITIDGERIVQVGPYRSDLSAKGLNDLNLCDVGSDSVAILPGLVNAHTHLEFSDLVAPLGHAGMPFPAWIGEVIRHRGTSIDQKTRGARVMPSAAEIYQQGINECLRWGTTTVGDIVTSQPLLPNLPLDLTAFTELRAFRAADIERELRIAESIAWLSEHLQRGLSPHAPYTVHPELLREAVQLSAKYRAPLAMHLAESPEELQLLRDGTGGFRELLEARGVWDESTLQPNSRPLDYLQALSLADRALVIHGNYLADDEIDFLSAHTDRMSAVYCPRTHLYFQHTEYPLQRMLSRGVNVALGTDSRASNPDLDLLSEIRFVADQHRIAPADAIRLGTLAGAKALGRAHEVGSLTAGKLANLAIVKLSQRSPVDPYEAVLEPKSRVMGTIYRGQLAYAEQAASTVVWRNGKPVFCGYFEEKTE